ncbi:helix-turn-helix domain-containing protein [Glutamicibacter sp. NPDC087344]|uniref:helix-turn-helix domain-containing protein n=1 Tax=Glutamicibacter sp. NPDC087344 TaxID=3363994 RepID=UPI0038187352
MDSGNYKSYMNVRETARLLGVHENTIRNWVKVGVLISARVPGATSHRFAREEVLRVQRQRGETTSSVAPALRVDNPELVTANALNSWAGSEDAKGAFPELMRRLLSVTPGISGLEVRAHEGIAAPGWDGTASSTGSPYLPAGELFFEFGTSQSPKWKAQSDYDKREATQSKDSNAIFVFATPRNWAGASVWASERAVDSTFVDVKAIDAHVLEGWLQATPSVHIWISERLGYRPRAARTIERWWLEFQAQTDPPLPSTFHLAGRLNQAEELHTQLTGIADYGTITIQAPWRDEALAFVYAALEMFDDLINRTILVNDSVAWDRLKDSNVPLVLIPLFRDGLNLGAALERGHRVVLVADPNDLVRSSKKISLNKIDYSPACEALKIKGADSNKVGAMVSLARRSMPALFRSIAREPRLAAPDWVARPEWASIFGPLVLIGSWSNQDGDLNILEKLTGHNREDIERLLKSLASRADAPFVYSGGVWRLTSPVEAALLLLPRITTSDLARWAEAVPEVLLDADPFNGMDSPARLTANIQGIHPKYSKILQKGLAAGLALAAASDAELPSEIAMQNRVDSIVHGLLETANSDISGQIWQGLAHVLPNLAEAAPEVFQDAVGLDLERENPVLRNMFQDRESNAFGSSSPHPNLLWAIEALCWSPAYFGRAADLLARLASIDPGGQLSNRPIESLQNLTLGWCVQSGASVDDKLTIIERFLARETDIGWKLIMGVWPSQHSVAFPPHAPAYRDWAPARQAVSYADWGRYIQEITKLAVATADNNPERWRDLIPKIDELPLQERKNVIAVLGKAVHDAVWTTDERFAVWEVLNAEADRHEEYSDSEWAMPTDDVALFRSIARKLKPTQDARRFSALFDWNARVPGYKFGDDGFEAALNHMQQEALEEVLSRGLKELESLIVDVKMPHAVGHQLAAKDDAPEPEILGWMDSDESNLRQAAISFASDKIRVGGIAWLNDALGCPALASAVAQERLMAAVPLSRTYWTKIASFEKNLEAAYWRHAQHFRVSRDERPEAIHQFLEHGRPWEATALLSAMLKDNNNPEINLIKEVFSALRVVVEPIQDVTMSGYYVGRLLEYMEQHVPDDSELPGYEFFFFELLNEHRPSEALYRALCNDPTDFVNMLKLLFRGEGESHRTLTSQEQAIAQRSFSVLHEWRRLPGLRDDGTINAGKLTKWVRSARLALSDCGRGSIGDEQIGQILASSPVGTDGVWPAEPVREIIENVGNARIDTGLHIGKTNQRGITTRGMFDGGDQERALEKEYSDMAAKISTQWPRTARMLRGIANSYQLEARRHDAEAERMGDDG